MILLELLSKCGTKENLISGPFRPRLVKEAFSRRANHQFTLVVLIIELSDGTI